MSRSVFLCLLIPLVTATAAADELTLRTAKPQKLLVLTSGRVFGGQLISRTDGYDVILPTGRMYVSSDRIRFLATSMQDAYEKMSYSMPNKTPVNHVQMARWCLTNGLQAQARKELLNALHLDPDYSLAKSMLEALTRQAKRADSKAESAQDILTTMSAQRNGVADRRSLGGLPVETARSFTVRIQTLLSNKCGNAKCHGGGDSGFQFVHVRRASSVVIAEQNLASVLQQIDLTDPQRSPLLVKAASMHGGTRSPLFPGRAGGDQFQMLRDWVNEVSIELNPSLNSSLGTPGSGTVGSRPTKDGNPITRSGRDSKNQTMKQASYESSSTTGMPVDGVKIQQRSKTETDGQFGQAAMEAVRDNPFDPMIFNRRYHGKTRSSR